VRQRPAIVDIHTKRAVLVLERTNDMEPLLKRAICRCGPEISPLERGFILKPARFFAIEE